MYVAAVINHNKKHYMLIVKSIIYVLHVYSNKMIIHVYCAQVRKIHLAYRLIMKNNKLHSKFKNILKVQNIGNKILIRMKNNNKLMKFNLITLIL
jgi:hypothetical protein